MITNVYINEIIAGAQRAAADYAYRISRQSLSGENPDALWERLDVCINGATNLINNEGLTDHENQIIIDKLLIRGGIGNYGTAAITFTPITVAPIAAAGNLTGMVTSIGLVTTVVTNANLTGPIYSIGNATGITAQTGTTTVFAMQNAPTFTTNITTPLIIGGTAVGGKVTYKPTTGIGTTSGVAHQFVGGNNGAVDIMRLYNNGTIGIGGPGSSNVTLRIDKNITGSTDSFGIYSNPTIQSDVTNFASIYSSRPVTATAIFNIASIAMYDTQDVVIGAGSSVTNQYGYICADLSSATNNYGFIGGLSLGANKWNIYMNGTASNYIAGNVGIGITTFGTNSTQTLSLGTGVAPSTSIADSFQMYSADQTAGNACPFFRTENGGIIKLFTGAALTAALTTVTFTSPGTPDYAWGAGTNTNAYGWTTNDEFKTAASVIASLQVRVGQLESRLQANGLIS